MAHATVRDVARMAGVSVASVSRALNGSTSVRSEMRQRIEAVAQQLGYVPHVGARSLSMARTHTIGVMLPDLHGEFFSELVRGIDREASACGLHLLLSNMHGDLHRASEVMRTMRGRVDGLVVMAPDLDVATLFGGLPATIPAILINGDAGVPGRPALRVNNHAAAVAMVDHLVDTGRRRIVHLTGPMGNVEARDRLRGYRDAIRDHGLTEWVIEGDFSEEAGLAAATELVGRIDQCDALFAANDMMAITAMAAFREAGIAVPDQLAVAGFDDVPLARFVSPPLTTMRVDVSGMGARAVRRLALIINDQADDQELEPRLPTLVVRQTTSLNHQR